MQSSVFKNVCFLVILFILFFFNSSAQSLSYHLSKADSLFQQKRYTQSLELYQSIYAQKQYTPAMFLKMAYIEEGLDHIPQAMYYLNLYHLASQDDRVLIKINDVAQKHGLDGYTITDTDRILKKYNEYHQIITGLFILILFILAFLMFYKRSKNERPIMGWIAMLLILMGLLVHINLEFQESAGIISKPNSYMMSGPSAGASVLQIIHEGNRVKITGKEDVWVKVRINAKDGYVKKDNLLLLSL